MGPDNSFVLENTHLVPETLRGTRQGLFFLLAQEAKQKAHSKTKQKVVAPATPSQAQHQPAQHQWSDLLSRDDFQFSF
jgi:hypothetical protein